MAQVAAIGVTSMLMLVEPCYVALKEAVHDSKMEALIKVIEMCGRGYVLTLCELCQMWLWFTWGLLAIALASYPFLANEQRQYLKTA